MTLDDKITGHLQANAGKPFDNPTLARLFKVELTESRAAIERLVRQSRIRAIHDGRRRNFYVPTPEQLQALEQIRPAPQARTEYQLPSHWRKWPRS